MSEPEQTTADFICLRQQRMLPHVSWGDWNVLHPERGIPAATPCLHPFTQDSDFSLFTVAGPVLGPTRHCFDAGFYLKTTPSGS